MLNTHFAIQQSQELFECKTVEDVHKLLKEGVCIDTRRLVDGCTPLIIHTAAGNKEIVQELIKWKANVDLQDSNGWSALMFASQNGNTEIVQDLVFAGAIPDLKSKEVAASLYCVYPSCSHMCAHTHAGPNSFDVCYHGWAHQSHQRAIIGKS